MILRPTYGLLALLMIAPALGHAHGAVPHLPRGAEEGAATPDEGDGHSDGEGQKNKEQWDVSTAELGPMSTVRFDVEQGTWMSVDVSPDGRTLVFDLLGDIYRMPIEGGQAELVRGGRSYDVQPRFSPDGAWISFTSDTDGGDNLHVMRADGSDVRAVSAEGFRLLNNGVWHPSGAYLVGRKHFTSRRSAGAGELWLYDVQHGGDGVRLVERPTDQKDLGEPALSADGRYLYYSLDITPGKTFEYNKNPHDTIYVIRRLELSTGETVTVAGGAGGSVRPQPSPDGRSLAFVRRMGPRTALMLLDLDTGVERVLYDGLDPDQQETWALFGVYPGFSFTPDGGAIVVWAGGQLKRVDVATGVARQIPFKVTVEQQVVDALRFAPDIGGEALSVKAVRWPVVSPDGALVAFQALGHIWLHEVSSGKARRLTSATDFEFYPSFSPDSKRVLYTTWNDVRGGQVVSVGLNGKRAQVHSDRPGHYIHPRYSADGARIVYQRLSGDRARGPAFGTDPGIYLVQTKGGPARLVTADGSSPRFCADGSRLHLTEWTPEKKTLYSVDLYGGNRRDLVTSERAMELELSPDERFVAFTELWDVYVAPRPEIGGPLAVGPKMDSLPVRKLSEVSGGYLSWSADSAQVRFSLGPDLFMADVAPRFEGEQGDGQAPEPQQVALGFEVPTARPAREVAFVGATILTMGGAGVIEDGVVRVSGRRIVAVGERGEVDTSGAQLIDVAGKVLMPGFVDIHAHMGGPEGGLHAQQYWPYLANLAFGVTTTHDPSNDTEEVFASSELVASGEMLGPRVFSTGTVLYGAEGEFKAVVNGLDDASRHLKRLKAWGAFSAKSYNQPRRNQRQQLIRAARDLEMMVVPEGGSCFVHNMSEILDGHTTVEHALPIAPLYDDVLSLFSASRTAYTPTLNVAYGGLSGEIYWYTRTEVEANARLMRFVPRKQVTPNSMRNVQARDWDHHHIAVAAAAAEIHRRGGIVALGSHGQMQGLGAHWELWSFVLGGMTPMEALEVATLSGARALGLDGQLGSVEVGKLADLIVLDEDPRLDITRSDSVSLVMVGGRLMDARTLEQLLPEAAPLPPGPRQQP